MQVSEGVLKWALRFYPPLFFQRIWISRIEKNFCGATVKICNSILNRNFNRSIFGGTIFSAADPLVPVLLYQKIKRKGYDPIIWLKSSEVQYLKPGKSDLLCKVEISEEQIEEICSVLDRKEKFIKSFTLEFYDRQHQLCVQLKNEVYVRHL